MEIPSDFGRPSDMFQSHRTGIEVAPLKPPSHLTPMLPSLLVLVATAAFERADKLPC